MALLEHLAATLRRWESDTGADIDSALGEIRGDLMSFLAGLKTSLARNPEPVFAILRKIKPILVVDNFALVTRFDDVQEVLARDEIFQVTYGPKMQVITASSNFFLGMQNTPDYTRDVSNMRTAVRRDDVLGRIVPFVSRAASDVVTKSGGRMDVVQQLTRVVPTRLIGDYFGAPPDDEQELADGATVMFQFLFTDLKNDPEVGRKAREAAVKARAWLDRTITARKAAPAATDDILGRCLAMQAAGLPGMDDLGIRNNLIGLIVGAIPTTSKCCAQALDQLLQRPEALAGAQAAAAADNDALLASYVFEALRFDPNNSGVFRAAAEDYVLARGMAHAARIPKGTTVLAATQSAMFDESKVDNPSAFQTGRPDYLSMHFGYGLHTCFGQYINRAQIPGILKPLLRCKSLRRAPGDAGTLQYEGPFPSSMTVLYEQAASGATG
jgi:cytochrome P450